jgi:hypothetical protein
MPTKEMEFWLYLPKLSKQALTRILMVSEQTHNNLEVLVNKVDEGDTFFKQEGHVIVSELCELPYWQLIILTPIASIAFEIYLLYLAQGLNVCLFDPKAKAVFVNFQQGLLARKVAHLWRKKARSDKVYHLYLTYEPNTRFYTIIRRYGKRDGILWQLERCYGVRQQEAEKEWQRIFEQKIRKGYKLHRTFQAIQLEFEL